MTGETATSPPCTSGRVSASKESSPHLLQVDHRACRWYAETFGFSEIEELSSPLFAVLSAGAIALGFHHRRLRPARIEEERGVSTRMHCTVRRRRRSDRRRRRPPARQVGARLIKELFDTLLRRPADRVRRPRGERDAAVHAAARTVAREVVRVNALLPSPVRAGRHVNSAAGLVVRGRSVDVPRRHGGLGRDRRPDDPARRVRVHRRPVRVWQVDAAAAGVRLASHPLPARSRRAASSASVFQDATLLPWRHGLRQGRLGCLLSSAADQREATSELARRAIALVGLEAFAEPLSARLHLVRRDEDACVARPGDSAQPVSSCSTSRSEPS